MHEKEEPVLCRLDCLREYTHPLFTLTLCGTRTIQAITVTDEDFPLIVRTVQPRDTIELRFGTKKLNRWFIDRKVPLWDRDRWLVVENAKKNVIFVPKIGCDINHYSTKPNLFMVE